MNKTKQFGLKWNYIYRALLAFLLITRSLGLLSAILQLFTLTQNSYFDYNSNAWYVCSIVIVIILEITRIIYNFRLMMQLGSPSKETYYNLLIHFSLSIILSFFSGLLNVNFIGGIIAALFTLLCITPNFIYYRKRRLWFGITFTCALCGKEEKQYNKYTLERNNITLEYCIDCYNTQRRSKTSQPSINKTSSATDNYINNNTSDSQHNHITHTEQKSNTESYYCRKCGLEIDNDSHFCKRCGTKTNHNICTQCGSPLESDSVFCHTCGTRIINNKEILY